MSIVIFLGIFAIPNLRGNYKRGHRKCHKSRKYQSCKSYISPTTTIPTEPKDSRNQNNNCFGQIHNSSIDRCKNIKSDKCA